MITEYRNLRAEYHDVKDCFENLPASLLLSPLFFYKGTNMLIGERGCGKTHIIKLLSKEMPVDIYHLNKEKLNNNAITFSQISSASNPVAVIVDDVHYLIKMMQISNLYDGKLREEEVLGKLEEFKKLSQEKNANLILVADDGPAGLAMRFKNNDNRKSLLVLLDECVETSDDAQFFLQYLGKGYEPNKIINLSYRGFDAAYRHLNSGNIIPSKAIQLWGKSKLFREFLLADKGIWIRSFAFSKKNTIKGIKEGLKNKLMSELNNQRNLLNYYYEKLESGCSSTNYYPNSIDTTSENIQDLESKLGDYDEFFMNLIRKNQGQFVIGMTRYKDLPDLEEVEKMRSAISSCMDDKIYSKINAVKNKLIKQFNMIDVPCAYTTRALGESLFFPFKSGYINADFYLKGKTNFENGCGAIPIASIRELKALNQELGGVNRECLGIQFGEKTNGVKILTGPEHMPKKALQDFAGIFYTNKELRQLHQVIIDTYNSIIGCDASDDLIKKLSMVADEDFHATMINHSLKLE